MGWKEHKLLPWHIMNLNPNTGLNPADTGLSHRARKWANLLWNHSMGQVSKNSTVESLQTDGICLLFRLETLSESQPTVSMQSSTISPYTYNQQTKRKAQPY